MKRESKMNRVSSSRLVVKNRKLAVAAVMGLAACAAAAFFVAQAYNSRKSEAVISTSSPQGAVAGRSRLHTRLTLQPQAYKMSRRLGLRFLTPGREVSFMVGSLTIGSQRNPIQITRSLQDDGEQLSIALGGGQASLTWDIHQGARSGNSPASGPLRSLIESLALDSPDQFVLAQLRGASYETIGQGVRPSDLDAENYSGPLWSMVRVIEPPAGHYKPASQVRLYFINEETGLLDRVSSAEQREVTVAEFSDWIKVGDQLLPRRISWSRKGQIVMQLEITQVEHRARQ